jgi:GTP-sensing pleiotropic transcriptional regulator CodY
MSLIQSTKMKKKIKNLIKCNIWSSNDVKYIMSYCVSFKDKHGMCIYTFETKKKAEEFMKELTTKK